MVKGFLGRREVLALTLGFLADLRVGFAFLAGFVLRVFLALAVAVAGLPAVAGCWTVATATVLGALVVLPVCALGLDAGLSAKLRRQMRVREQDAALTPLLCRDHKMLKGADTRWKPRTEGSS